MKSTESIIKSLLLMAGIFMMASGVLWTFSKPGNEWLWFSRTVAGLVFLGLSAIIKTK